MNTKAHEFVVALQQLLIPQGVSIPDRLIPSIVEKFEKYAPSVPARAERLTCNEIDAFREFFRSVPKSESTPV